MVVTFELCGCSIRNTSILCISVYHLHALTTGGLEGADVPAEEEDPIAPVLTSREAAPTIADDVAAVAGKYVKPAIRANAERIF
jgi:hypothetical protein